MEVTPNQSLEKEVTIKQAIVITLVVVVIVAILGTAVGYMFFWRPVADKKDDVELKSIKTLMQKDPNNVRGFLAMSSYYLKRTQPEEAMKWIEKAQKIDKNSKLVKFNLGLALMQMKKYDEAVKNMEPLAKDTVFNYDAEFYMGAAYYMKGDYPKAIDRFKMAIIYNGAAADAHVFIAKAYYKNGDQKAAQEHLKKALAMVPDYKEALDVKKIVDAKGQLND